MQKLNPAEFRQRFPILEHTTYVNSCSQGALSIDVERALGRFIETWHVGGSPWELWGEHSEQLRRTLAAAIGADPDEVALMPSASAGINAIASALNFEDRRRQVVIGDFEFPTMAQIWLAQQVTGAEIVRADAKGDELPLASYEASIGERTLIVPATHVCFRNGYRTDIAGLARLCHERGAYLMVDDYQRTGTGPIDVHALDVDFMVGGCLKYLISASGIGFLYVRRSLIERLVPRATGWKGRVNPFAYRIDAVDWPASARRFETGALPIPSVYSAVAGVSLLADLGWQEIEQHISSLVAQFIERAAMEGFDIATPRDPGRRGPLVVLRSHDANQLRARLEQRKVITSARGNGLRLAFHAYNDESDLDRLLEALRAESALLESAPPVHSSRAHSFGGVPGRPS
jgi:selenocysteine lyase/cysteine desulfurase